MPSYDFLHVSTQPVHASTNKLVSSYMRMVHCDNLRIFFSNCQRLASTGYVSRSYLTQSHRAQAHLNQTHLTQTHLTQFHHIQSHLTLSDWVCPDSVSQSDMTSSRLTQSSWRSLTWLSFSWLSPTWVSLSDRVRPDSISPDSVSVALPDRCHLTFSPDSGSMSRPYLICEVLSKLFPSDKDSFIFGFMSYANNLLESSVAQLQLAQSSLTQLHMAQSCLTPSLSVAWVHEPWQIE